MSIHWDKAGNRYVVRFRDGDGRNRAVTVNAENLLKYELYVPDRITERVAKRLEQAVLARETAPDGSMRSIDRRRLLWLEAVARYLPPVLDETECDTWETRPANQRLENERTYSHNQLDRMQRVLTAYFPSYLEYGKIRWRRRGKREHNRVDKTCDCSRRIGGISREDVAGFQIYLSQEADLSCGTVRGYMATLKTFLSWCYKRGLTFLDAGAEVKPPPDRNREVKWLDGDQIKVLSRAVRGHRLVGPVCTILGLGLRRSEMVNLEWRDINFEVGIVRVRGTKTARAFREIPLPKKLADYFHKLSPSERYANVLLNTEGNPWCKSSLSSAIRRFRVTEHVPFYWNFQVLRATYGSMLVKQGIPISHVSMALGHTDVRITQRWYIGLKSTHVSPAISKAINRVLSAY